MPKKTKKEKLLASKRRSQLLPVAIDNNGVNSPIAPANQNTFSFSLATPKIAQDSVKSANTPQYLLIKKDLTKTIFITGIILISEFLLTRWLPQ
ncbi:hypothetical protein HZB58_00570 [Candidatus Gottesmanbacteria bacterium]|nr:hypothetical protein [Candidatus Gottesmanbacteria bacterium]